MSETQTLITIFLTIFTTFIFNSSPIYSSYNDVEDCTYTHFITGKNGGRYLPWTAKLIYRRNTGIDYFPGAIINNSTILLNLKKLSSKFDFLSNEFPLPLYTPKLNEAFKLIKILISFPNTYILDGHPFAGSTELPFQLLPFTNYTIVVGHEEYAQNMTVKYIKPIPNFARGETGGSSWIWQKSAHDFVLIFLSSQIKFIENYIGPVCLSNSTLTRQIYELNNSSISQLNTNVTIGGKTTYSYAMEPQDYYQLQLGTNEHCQGLWKLKSDDVYGIFVNRTCGYVSIPNQNYSCVHQDSGVMYQDTDNKFYWIGFMNNYYSDHSVCDSKTLVFISLAMSDTLNWIQNEIQCRPTQFACDYSMHKNVSSPKCIDLKLVCNGQLDCQDGSDEGSYCSSLAICGKDDFRCPAGVSSYCIPKVNPKTNKTAEYCDSFPDCKSGEDENTQLCSYKLVPIAIGIGAIIIIFVMITILCGLIRRSGLDEQYRLTDEQHEEFLHGKKISPKQNVEDEFPINDEVQLIQPSSSSQELESLNNISNGFYPENIFLHGFDVKTFGFSMNRCTLEKQVGRGCFSIVRKGLLYKSSSNGYIQVAIKTPPIQPVKRKEFRDIYLTELLILQHVQKLITSERQINIVEFIGADVNEVYRCKVFVAFKYYKNGNLHDYIKINYAEFKDDICPTRITLPIMMEYVPESNIVTQAVNYQNPCQSLLQLVKWINEIVSAMCFLSKHKIIHLDLACRNILVDDEKIAKVGDFGLSRLLYDNSYYKFDIEQQGTENKGMDRNSFPWQCTAPEIWEEKKCYPKSDVWSFGVTLWEIFTLCDVPWARRLRSKQHFSPIEQGSPKPFCANDEVYQQIQHCLEYSHLQRPNFEQLQNYFENLLRVLVDRWNNGVFVE